MHRTGYALHMTMTTRVLWAFGVICIALFVVASGRTNVHNFRDVQTSIEEIYEDRLVVKGLIFELSSMLHDKELAQVTGDTAFYANDNAAVDARITAHLERFRATKLTEAESITLDRFASHVADLQRVEGAYPLSDDTSISPEEAEVLAAHMADLKADLRDLASIQLEEGKRRLAIAERAEADMNMIAWIEAALMVFLAAQLIALFFIPAAPRNPVVPREA